jgi:hypothetical protein
MLSRWRWMKIRQNDCQAIEALVILEALGEQVFLHLA